jgi:hypothetical protein
MNDAFRRSASILLRFFPPALIVLMLVVFGYYAFTYKWILDDFQFRVALRGSTIADTSLYFYKNFNGRFASHLFLCSVFSLFRNSVDLLFIYRFLMLLAFIISLAHLLKNYLALFRETIITTARSIFFATFITSFLFFFFFAGRMELWFWISSTGVYLIGMIIGMNAFALLLSEDQTPLKTGLAAFLFFLAGGFSEAYAIMFLLLLLYIDFKFIRKQSRFAKQRQVINFMYAGMIIGLLANFLSHGTHNRLNTLRDFGILQALKNTTHSLAFSFLRYKYFLIELALTGIVLLYAHFHFPKAFAGWKHFFKRATPVVIFISISFFIPCYILSDIVPDRAASIGYFAGVLFLFDHFIFSSRAFAQNKKGLLN